MKAAWTKVLFWFAGLYDGVLGLTFLLAGEKLFSVFGVTPPNHPGYIQFPALLLVIFAFLFFRIAIDPVRYRHLMPYGMGLKLAYCATVFGHQFGGGGIPYLWIPWAWADLIFLVMFSIAWMKTGRAPASPPPR